MSICERSVSIGVSRKSVGEAEPAFAQTMSGGAPLFQAVTSEIIRSFSAGWVTSALM